MTSIKGGHLNGGCAEPENWLQKESVQSLVVEAQYFP